MILITGSDSSHETSLRRFLASVTRYEPEMTVIVYDLGMTPRERRRIEKEYGRYQIRKFDYGRYPAHLFIGVKAGEFAWKPAIMWEVICQMQAPVCWMDAGNLLTENLSRLRDALSCTGFYSPNSPGTVTDWTHPKMLEFFGLDATWGKGRTNLNGACVAFDPRFAAAAALARKWNEGALQKSCIAPAGSDRSNHRQDQALLTVLAHLEGLADAGEHRYLGFLVQQDIPPPVLRRARRRIGNLLAWMIVDFHPRRRLRF